MSRHIVDILGIGPSRYDISKQQSIEGKIEKYQSISAISPIYQLLPDISESKSVKVTVVQKNAKKKNHFGLYIGDIDRYIGPIADFLINFSKKKKQYLRQVSC